MNRLDVLGRIGRLRSDVKRQSTHLDADVGGEPRQAQQVLRIAAELAREIAHRSRAAEGHPQEQLRAVGVTLELADLVRVVRHERAHAEMQGVADVHVALDRVGVDASLGRYAQALYELHLARRGQIEEGALLDHRAHDGRVRHGLERVVQVHARQRLAQLAKLLPYPLAVEDDERRAELFHQPADLVRLERIDEALASCAARHLGRIEVCGRPQISSGPGCAGWRGLTRGADC